MFPILFKVFLMCLTVSLRKKLKDSIFEIPIFLQTLKINNSRTTRANFINIHTVRKLMECSLTSTMFTTTVLKILISECRVVLSPAQLDTGNEMVKVSMKKQKKCSSFVEID